MPSACGVSWSGTSGGKLDESAIPDDDFGSHYLNAGDTKSDSSFPVVDGDGNLRAGNVNSAWDLRNDGEGVSEECLRKLDNAFEDNVLPDTAYENMETMKLGDVDVDGEFGMNLSFSTPESLFQEEDEFNKYGVRENEDGSVDVRFAAMEPGVWQGAEVSDDFLRNVVSKDYSRIPVQLDHSKSQRANVGFVEPERLKFDDTLYTQVHIPNTGSSIKDDIIADFTHDPPQITDISVSFDRETLEVERPRKRGDPVKFVDGRIREFSLTPFPAGYDEGGLTPAFSAAIEKASMGCGCFSEPDDPQSRLITRPHILIEK